MSCCLHFYPVGSLCICFVLSHILSFFSCFPALDPLRVFCLPGAVAHNAPLWPHFCLLAPYFTCVQLLHLLPPSLFTRCRVLTENLISLICLFTPGRRMDCRPARRLATTGQLPTFGLTAGGIVMRNTHGRPHSPSSRAIIRGGYLRKGVSITGFLFDNFSFCFSLSSFVFKSI